MGRCSYPARLSARHHGERPHRARHGRHRDAEHERQATEISCRAARLVWFGPGSGRAETSCRGSDVLCRWAVPAVAGLTRRPEWGCMRPAPAVVPVSRPGPGRIGVLDACGGVPPERDDPGGARAGAGGPRLRGQGPRRVACARGPGALAGQRAGDQFRSSGSNDRPAWGRRRIVFCPFVMAAPVLEGCPCGRRVCGCGCPSPGPRSLASHSTASRTIAGCT